jgi:cbb3-type cytochrome oxidase subunit 3
MDIKTVLAIALVLFIIGGLIWLYLRNNRK